MKAGHVKTERSIHSGRHTNAAVARMEVQLGQIARDLNAGRISTEQARARVSEVAARERAGLRSGERSLGRSKGKSSGPGPKGDEPVTAPDAPSGGSDGVGRGESESGPL